MHDSASLEALWEAPGATQLVDPPMGRFLIRRESLSFSIEEAPEEVEKKVKESMEVEMYVTIGQFPFLAFFVLFVHIS